uniref:Uncharacterized protein n=1 Tax=candidate division WOR-3 bacterium TaxID=2052148 RepID=A0A7C4XF88_UNCW3
MEIDVLCIGKCRNKKIAIATEVKSNLGISDVKDYLKALDDFFKFFSEYKGNILICVVSGIRLEEGVIRFAEKQGYMSLFLSSLRFNGERKG